MICIIFCHRRPDRSFHFKGKQFPICARCTGLVTGFLTALILELMFIRLPLMVGFCCIPLIIDGGLQLATNYESNNIKRFITGLLFMIGFYSLICVIL
ncbi:MAG: DUF2085 domain-containing protein [Methanobrevibacter sp.]|jgi:uncharacterized membrane protein|nr:DUF2085 domain-containing protein [Candidatus Methanovirga aequatorialis]